MNSTTDTATAPAIGPLRALRISAPVAACLAFLGYLAVAVWMTWPMPKDPTHLFYGGVGDPFGSLANLREMVENHQPPFLPGRLHDFSAPEGMEIPWVQGLAALPTTLVLYTLGIVFGPLLAYNIFAIAAFPLTGTSTFLLARKLSGNPWAALVAGWAFAFYPYAVIKGHGHYELVHGWVIVVSVWRVLALIDRPSTRNGVLAGIATVFAMAWTPYFILVCGVAFVTLAVGGLVGAAHRHALREEIVAYLVAGGLVLLYLATFYVLSVKAGTGQGLRTNDVQQLNVYSARPWEYVVPSADNPLVGGRTGPWLQRHIHGSNAAESTLYIGLSVLALAAAALAAALRRRLPSRTRATVFLLTVMGIVAAWVSAPPEGIVLGHAVPFPSKLITDVSSTWRVYARLVTDVMLAASLLAAIGVATLVRGRPGWARALILCVAAVVVIRLDLWPQPQGVNPTHTQAVYQRLAELPAGTVAAYPLTGADTYGEQFDQQWYDKPMLNGFALDSAAEQRANQLTDVGRPATATALAALGVRYAVVTIPAVREALHFGPGFRKVYDDPSGVIYEVKPPSDAPAAAAFTQDGFAAPEPAPTGGTASWLSDTSGTLELDGACTSCTGSLRLLLTSFARPRTVVVRDARGTTLMRRRIAGPTRVTLPVRFSRQSDLTVSVSPGPVPVRAVDPTATDTRSLALNVRVIGLRLNRQR